MTADNRESKQKARAGVFVSHCQLELHKVAFDGQPPTI
jgi:hypothetical protein